MKILHIALDVGYGTGADAIQTRNKYAIREYCGEGFKTMYVPFEYFFYASMHPALLDKSNPNLINRLHDGVIAVRDRYRDIKAFEKQVDDFNPDYIFCESSALTLADKRIFRKYKFIVFFHNIEKSYYEQQHPDYKTDEKKYRYYRNIIENERFICDNAEKIICINQRDADGIKSLYSRSADLILPTSMKDCFDEKYALNGKGDYLLFVGTDFFGNTDGLFRFIESCLDHISVPLLVVGRGMDKYGDRYKDKNVKFYGYVEDLGEFYKKAMAVVLPIISGSGMKTKTCEAFMFGKTVIGTNEAFEGYADVEKAGAVRANTKAEFIEAVNAFCKKEAPAFSQKARAYYLENYSLEKSKEKLFELFSSISEGVSGRDVSGDGSV